MIHEPIPPEDDEIAHRIIGAAIDLGLIINFNVPVLKDGIKRLVR